MTGAGVVVWITGLPAAGKTTLAEALRVRLSDAGRACAVLDGDAVRAAIVPRPAYTDRGRDDFYQTLAGLAAMLAAQGLAVLVPATAQRRKQRQDARALAPRFVEIWVRTPLATCAERDPKGLYAAARAHALTGLPGVDAPYEEPLAADVVADGGLDAAALDRACALVLTTADRPARPPAPASRPST